MTDLDFVEAPGRFVEPSPVRSWSSAAPRPALTVSANEHSRPALLKLGLGSAKMLELRRMGDVLSGA